jgi:hypothetical protein
MSLLDKLDLPPPRAWTVHKAAPAHKAEPRSAPPPAQARKAQVPTAASLAAALSNDGRSGSGPAAPAEAAAGAPFELGVPGLPSLKKKVSLGKVQFEVQVKPKLTISGKAALDDADRTKLQGAGVKLAVAWYEKEGAAAVADKGLLGNAKIQRKGLSLVATTSTRTKVGLLTLTLTFVGLGAKVTQEANAKAAVKVLEAEGELEPVAIKLGTQELLGVKFTDLEVKLGGAVSVAPEWQGMLIQWAVEQGAKDVALEAGEVGAVVVGAEVVIAGSIVAIGVATVGGAIYSIIQGWGIADLAKDYAPAVRAAQDGFKVGMSGGGAPGDRFGVVGHAFGRRNYEALFVRARKENPQASDDAIKAALAAKADAALKAVAGEIDKSVRAGMWDGYLAQHTTLLTGGDARWAYVACFGNEPNSQSPDRHWKKYMDLFPTQSKFSPK